MKEAMRFLVVGGVNTLWGYGLIFGFMYLAGWSPEASNISGYLISFVTSYALHRRFTFRSENAKRKEFIRYAAVFAIAFCANLAALRIFIHGFGLHEGLSQIGAGGVYVLTAYLLGKLYVFRKNERDHMPQFNDDLISVTPSSSLQRANRDTLDRADEGGKRRRVKIDPVE